MGTKRRPFLIFHRHNSKQNYCCIQKTVYDKLKATEAKFGRILSYKNIVIMNFDGFLNGIEPWNLAIALKGIKTGNKVRNNYNA